MQVDQNLQGNKNETVNMLCLAIIDKSIVELLLVE